MLTEKIIIQMRYCIGKKHYVVFDKYSRIILTVYIHKKNTCKELEKRQVFQYFFKYLHLYAYTQSEFYVCTQIVVFDFS